MRRLIGAALVAALLCSCSGFDRRLVAKVATARVYHQCVYELLCVSDVSKWECKDSKGVVIQPPAVRPVPEPGQCVAMFNAEEELRWQSQIAEAARAKEGTLPLESKKALKRALKSNGLR